MQYSEQKLYDFMLDLQEHTCILEVDSHEKHILYKYNTSSSVKERYYLETASHSAMQ